jgi:hypothetical protein
MPGLFLLNFYFYNSTTSHIANENGIRQLTDAVFYYSLTSLFSQVLYFASLLFRLAALFL